MGLQVDLNQLQDTIRFQPPISIARKKLVLYGQKGKEFVPKDVLVEFCPVAHAPQTAPQMDEVPWHLLTDKPVTPIVEGNLET